MFVVFFIRYVPTPDDIEMYKSRDPSELHVVDQYMMEVKLTSLNRWNNGADNKRMW